MAPGKKFFNVALPNDGLIDVVSIDGDISPLESIRFINEVERGSLINSPLVTYRKAAAYRIVPRNQTDGDVVIDGERFPFGPFQVEVHKVLGTVLSRSVP